jgi:penicillin-binding protein 1C
MMPYDAARRFAATVRRLASRFIPAMAGFRGRRFFAGAGISFALALLFFLPVAFLCPSLTTPLSSAIYDSGGKLLAASVAADGQWRLPAGPVPEKIEKALVAREDRRFRIHPGVDPFAIARAFALNARSGRVISGGSTITMQCVRLLEENPPRTVAQKFREAFLALLLETRYTKKDILALYAANAPFGGNVVGIEAASWRYYNRPPENLSWAEAATLAILPNQPGLVHPGSNRDTMREKRDRLLRDLRNVGAIDSRTLELSLDEPLPKEPYALPRLAPHYLERFAQNGRIVTAIDRALQENVSRILERWSARFALRGISNAAAIVMDTESGKVLAYVGNTGRARDDGRCVDVDIVNSRRSSGSILKPFLYAGMLDSGLLLPGELVIDIPTRIGSYKPENNMPQYHGAVRASEALSRSLNVPAVRELRDFGIAHFLDLLKSAGFTTFTRSADDYGLPLILGGGEVSLEETTRAYAALMNRAGGVKTADATAPHLESISAGAAWLTLDALLYGTRPEEESLWQSFASARKIAWKTGTSYGNRDAWAIGTTPGYTVGIWIGNATGEGRPELKSISTAAPVLFDIFGILPATDWPSAPETELAPIVVCAESGYLAGPECARTETALKPVHANDNTPCPYCRRVSLTPDGKWQATASDLELNWKGSLPRTESRFVLPPSIEYWYRKYNISYRQLPPWLPGHAGDSSRKDLDLVFPEPGARIFIPVNMTGKKESVVMQARHRDPGEILYWDLDGVYLGETRYYHDITASPGPGKHRITVTDEHGNRVSRGFEILEEN